MAVTRSRRGRRKAESSPPGLELTLVQELELEVRDAEDRRDAALERANELAGQCVKTWQMTRGAFAEHHVLEQTVEMMDAARRGVVAELRVAEDAEGDAREALG